MSHPTAVFFFIGFGAQVGGEYFTDWNSLYEYCKQLIANDPTKRLYCLGQANGYQFGTPFRIQWFGGGVQPESNRNKATLSRYNAETNSYVELVTLDSVMACLNYLNFIHANGNADHRTAIANFQIDTVFTNSDGSIL
jgi:hypothetical protein